MKTVTGKFRLENRSQRCAKAKFFPPATVISYADAAAWLTERHIINWQTRARAWTEICLDTLLKSLCANKKYPVLNVKWHSSLRFLQIDTRIQLLSLGPKPQQSKGWIINHSSPLTKVYNTPKRTEKKKENKMDYSNVCAKTWILTSGRWKRKQTNLIIRYARELNVQWGI